MIRHRKTLLLAHLDRLGFIALREIASQSPHVSRTAECMLEHEPRRTNSTEE